MVQVLSSVWVIRITCGKPWVRISPLGHTSVSAVVEGWLDSPGHCRNIMNDAFTEMGMAKAEDSESRYSTYWTQTLGNPR